MVEKKEPEEGTVRRPGSTTSRHSVANGQLQLQENLQVFCMVYLLYLVSMSLMFEAIPSTLRLSLTVSSFCF